MFKLIHTHPSPSRSSIFRRRICFRSPVLIDTPPISLLLQLFPFPLRVLLLLLLPIWYRPPPLLSRPILLIPPRMRIHTRIHRKSLLPAHYWDGECPPCSACCELADLGTTISSHVFVVDVADLCFLCGVQGNRSCGADVDGLGDGL